MSSAEDVEHDTRLDEQRKAAEESYAALCRLEEERRVADVKRLEEIFARVRREHPTWRYLLAGYNGWGDEGTMAYVGFTESETVAEEADGWSPPHDLITQLPEGIASESLEELLDHFIPGGYQDNDGGQGVVRVDLHSGQVKVLHQWNVSEVEEDVRAFNLTTSAAPINELTPEQP